MTVRTRFAPSPTGYLHIGAVRTMLYCYALAKKQAGSYIVRIEDTDRTRFVEDAVEQIFEVHKLYGLEPDESEVHGGELGPYVQSERLDLYQQYAHELVQKGFAYYCFLTKEETADLQNKFKLENKRFRSPYRDQNINDSLKLIEEGTSYTVRLKVPADRTIIYEDGVQGKMRFHTDEVDDQILLKQDGFPTYHLAVVVDDHLMKITHVFRAFEWIPSTPKQVLLYEALGWKMPQHYHLSTILDPEGGKLSKRKGATAALEFIKEGYLPEAVLNFLMLLGWSSPLKREHGEAEKEIFSLQEFVELFDVKDLNKSNPVFDRQKLLWFNKEYIQNKSVEEFGQIFVNWLEKYSSDQDLKEQILADAKLDQKLALIKERTRLLPEALEMIRFFYKQPEKIEWNIKQLKNIDNTQVVSIKSEITSLFEDLSDNSENWMHEIWEKNMRKIADKFKIKHGDAFMVLRVAITGSPFSPPLFEALQILGKEEVLNRLNK